MVKLEEYLQKLHLTTILDGLKDPDKNDIDHYQEEQTTFATCIVDKSQPY
jgi:hypothetical protein